MAGILALEGEIEKLLRRYDASDDPVEKRSLEAQLTAMRASLPFSAYINGPATGQADFGCILAGRPEFSRSSMPSPGPEDAQSCEQGWFMLTPNQIFVKNFLAIHDCLLLFHAVGTGKGCSAVSTAEYLRDTGVYKKPALVLMPRNLKPGFYKQIFNTDKQDDVGNQCTGDKYIRMVAPDADASAAVDDKVASKITKLVRKRYEVMSYGEFAKLVQSKCDAIRKRVTNADAQESKIARAMDELVADRLIVMDEVHNIKISELGEEETKINAPMIDLALQYARNTKLLLMTATPMYDVAEEIVWLLNLMRRVSGRTPIEVGAVFSGDGNLITPAGAAVLRNAVSGYVSYLRADNPWTYPVQLDPNDRRSLVETARPTRDFYNDLIAPDSQLRETQLTVSIMSASQQRAYDATLPRVLRLDKLKANKEHSNTGMSGLLQLSTIHWPSKSATLDDVAIGSEGLQSCLSVSEKNGRKRFAYHSKILNQYGRFLGSSLLHLHSPKLQTIMDYIRSSTGVVYVYSQFLYSGLIPLALALEHAGVLPLRSDRRMWASADEGGVDSPILVDGKPARYIMLSGEHKHEPDDIAAARSPSNAMGGVVKVILCSKVGTEGFDLRHVREVHIIEPWYNVSRVLQAVGRAVRRCSHFYLPPALRNVTIYHHATMSRGGSKARESTDHYAYRIAENKNRVVEQVHNILRHEAVDCQLNAPARPATSDVITLETSQGKLLKNFRLSDAFPDSKQSCAPCRKPTSRADVRDNLSSILDGVDEYRRLVVNPMFTKRVHYTFAELAERGKAMFKTRFDEDILSACLQNLIVRQVTLFGPLEEDRGHLIYHDGEYIFQPFSNSDVSIPLSTRHGEGLSREPLRLSVNFHSMKGGGGPTSPGASTTRIVKDRVDHLVDAVQRVWSGAVAWLGLGAFVDFVVDRLSASELEALAGQLSRTAHEGPLLSHFELHVLNSLRAAGIWTADDLRSHRLFLPRIGVWKRVLPSGEVLPSRAPASARVDLQRLELAMSPTPSRHRVKQYLRRVLPPPALDSGTLHAPTAHLGTLRELCQRVV